MNTNVNKIGFALVTDVKQSFKPFINRLFNVFTKINIYLFLGKIRDEKILNPSILTMTIRE